MGDRRHHPELYEADANVLRVQKNMQESPLQDQAVYLAVSLWVRLLRTVTQSCLLHLELLASRLDKMTSSISVSYQKYLLSSLGEVWVQKPISVILECLYFRRQRDWRVLSAKKKNVSWGGAGIRV